MVTINTGVLWNYTTDFGVMGGEGNAGFLSYTWPGGVGLNNYYLWLSYIWAGAMIAGEPHVTWHDYASPEWGPGPDPVSVESRGDALQITTHFNDCASFNSYNADGSHLGLEMTMRALSWNEPVLRDCIAWELDIIYHPSSPYEDFHWGVPPLGVSEGEKQVVRFDFNVLPNVTRGVADVSFTLPSESDVEISLYDVTGRLVKRILSGRFRSGKHSLKIDFNNDNIGASNGVYFLRFKTGKKRLTRKILLLR